MKFFITAALTILVTINYAGVWTVGPTQTYTLPSQVKNLVQDGDTIYIEGGVYSNDATKWTKNDLKIIGLGTGNNRTVLQYTGDIPNGKGIFVFETPGLSDNPYIENIVFDGAQVSDANGANGAGIRFQANNLTVKNCKFMNCQNGILEGNGSVTTSNVVILDSEFYNNGYQLQNDPNFSGYEHHIYISASADTLIVMNCYFHHPRGQGNSLKTRAQRSFILYNMIDEGTGYGSYELNIAQGGLNIIMGNVIIQGPAGANHGIVGYDAVTNVLEDFYFVNNTVINQFAGNNKYFNIAPSTGINTFKIYNNIFASVPGASNILFNSNVPSVTDTSHNVFFADYLTSGFLNPSGNDYTLTATATALIDMGINAGTTNTSFSLTPVSMYQSFDLPLLNRSITGANIDIGAYEYPCVTGINHRTLENKLSIYPNPANGVIKWSLEGINRAKKCILNVYNGYGQLVFSAALSELNNHQELDLTGLPPGLYTLRIHNDEDVFSGKFIVQ
ncbi:MAG: hypothetical protein BWY70_01283 [Bacteroidetes bacterium ADurb.Bin408]|nr:MAG: hypothetical protein BWY70_01283 [Bacteroidetes bacterium ADurb.Bin408]